MCVFVLQAGQQDIAVGHDQNLGAHGLESRFELPDDAALPAECEICRPILQQAGQAKAAAVGHGDLCRHQQTTLGIDGDVVGHAGQAVGEIHLGFAVGGKRRIESAGSVADGGAGNGGLDGHEPHLLASRTVPEVWVATYKENIQSLNGRMHNCNN
ncbi:hypothetical protein D3C81_1802210 [compost metagenome]